MVRELRVALTCLLFPGDLKGAGVVGVGTQYPTQTMHTAASKERCNYRCAAKNHEATQ